MDRERLTASVRGVVQGVGFRAYVLRHAWRLGVSGYARNVTDGTVEVVAEGSRKGLDELLGALRAGPAGSYVADVQYTFEAAAGGFEGFEIG